MSKWSDDENKLLIKLVEKKMKWRDISERFPGRTPDSCRVHYHHHNDQQGFDKEMKTNFAKAYERYDHILVSNNRSDDCRLKKETWTPIANELGISWEVVEALHWKMSKDGVARRASAVPSKRRGGNRTSSPVPSCSTECPRDQAASPRPNIQLPPLLQQHPSQLHGQAQLPSFKELLDLAKKSGLDLAR